MTYSTRLVSIAHCGALSVVFLCFAFPACFRLVSTFGTCSSEDPAHPLRWIAKARPPCRPVAWTCRSEAPAHPLVWIAMAGLPCRPMLWARSSGCSPIHFGG